jgi:hypothetical protein
VSDGERTFSVGDGGSSCAQGGAVTTVLIVDGWGGRDEASDFLVERLDWEMERSWPVG